MRYLVVLLAASLAACGGGGGGSSPSNPPVADTTAPVITLVGDNPQIIEAGDAYVELGATATDDRDGNLTNSIVIDASTVNTSVPGNYVVTYDVSDAAGNPATTVIRTVSVTERLSGIWLGFFETSLISETHLFVEISVIGSSISGSFEDSDGRQGSISVSLADDQVVVELEQTNTDCNGTFVGTGELGGGLLTITFSGTNCEGDHTEGEGQLILQQSDVLAWGQARASSLHLRNGELFWSNDSMNAVNKLNIATREVSVLAPRMVAINSVFADGVRILWTDLDDEGMSGCFGDRVARTLYAAEPDGSHARALASGSFCGANVGTEKIFSDGVYAYWAKVAPYQRSIERVPLAGGRAELLAEPGDGFQGFAIDDRYFYWGEVVPSQASMILRCPLSGCNQQPPEQVLATDGTIEMWSNFVITGDLIVLGIKRVGLRGYEISTIPKDGGDLSDIAHSDGQILRILADSTSAYWVTSGYGLPVDDTLYKVSLNGGDPSALVSVLATYHDIVLGQDRVYFTNPTWPVDFQAEVRWVDKNGGPVQTLTGGLVAPYKLAVEPDGNVICADSDFGGFTPAGIYRISPSGIKSNLLSGFDSAAQITIDDRYVYGTQGFNVKRVSIEGAAGGLVAPTGFYVEAMDTDGTYVYWLEQPFATVYRAVGEQTDSAEFVSSGNGYAVDLVVHNGFVYWIEGYEILYRAPTSGGPAEILADDLAWGMKLAADDRYIYLIESDARDITRMPLSGGQRTVLASSGLNFGWFALTHDSANLYLATPDGLYKIPKEGGAKTKYGTRVFFDFEFEGSIGVDDQFLYWAEPRLGAIKRQKK